MLLLIKKIALILGTLLFLYTAYLWYGYIKDNEYGSQVKICNTTSGGIIERKTCLEFPNRKHEAKKSLAVLMTAVTVALPAFLVISEWCYNYFFLRKRS